MLQVQMFKRSWKILRLKMKALRIWILENIFSSQVLFSTFFSIFFNSLLIVFLNLFPFFLLRYYLSKFYTIFIDFFFNRYQIVEIYTTVIKYALQFFTKYFQDSESKKNFSYFVFLIKTIEYSLHFLLLIKTVKGFAPLYKYTNSN